MKPSRDEIMDFAMYSELKTKGNEFIDFIRNEYMKFFRQNVQGNRCFTYTEKNLKSFFSLGLYSIMVPEKYGGVGANIIEFLRLLEQVAGTDPLFALSLVEHTATVCYLDNLLAEEKKADLLSDIDCSAKYFLSPPVVSVPGRKTDELCRLEDNSCTYSKIRSVSIDIGLNPRYLSLVLPLEQKKSELLVIIDTEKHIPEIIKESPQENFNFCSMNYNTLTIIDEEIIKQQTMINQDMLLIHKQAGISIIALSLLRKALQGTWEYASNRVLFKQRLSEFYLIRKKFVDMEMDQLIMESLIFFLQNRLLGKWDTQLLHFAMAIKYICTKKALTQTDMCMYIRGANGYIMDNDISYIFFEAKLLNIWQLSNLRIKEVLINSGFLDTIHAPLFESKLIADELMSHQAICEECSKYIKSNSNRCQSGRLFDDLLLLMQLKLVILYSSFLLCGYREENPDRTQILANCDFLAKRTSIQIYSECLYAEQNN